MAEPLVPDVAVNVCHNCIPKASKLPRQWKQGPRLIVLRELPCSGKVDLQYLLHTLEGVRGGVCVVACPPGKCRLAQGNHRAEVRIGTLRRLLTEIGLESERAELVHCSAEDSPARFEQTVREATERILKLSPNPLVKAASPAQSAMTPGSEGKLASATQAHRTLST